MRKLAAYVPVLMIAGCSIEAPDPDMVPQVASRQSAVTELTRDSTNALAPEGLASSALTTATLDGANLAAMGANGDARKVLAYAVGCALDSSQTVSFTIAGTTYTATGGLGMARAWPTRPLSAYEAAWVSACVFAHANELSTVIWISVRGDEGILPTSASEREDYQIEEGAFWGNAFVDLGPVAAYSCDGVDQAADDSYADLPYRQCAQWDGVTGSNKSPCGMGYAGLCSVVCTSAIAPYAGCSFLGGPSSPAVVTNFLAGAPE